jgi:hypothetical protein
VASELSSIVMLSSRDAKLSSWAAAELTVMVAVAELTAIAVAVTQIIAVVVAATQVTVVVVAMT